MHRYNGIINKPKKINNNNFIYIGILIWQKKRNKWVKNHIILFINMVNTN